MDGSNKLKNILFVITFLNVNIIVLTISENVLPL